MNFYFRGRSFFYHSTCLESSIAEILLTQILPGEILNNPVVYLVMYHASPFVIVVIVRSVLFQMDICMYWNSKMNMN